MPANRINTMTFASVYPLYVAKAERKSRTRAEVDQIIFWLTGYDAAGLQAQIDSGATMQASGSGFCSAMRLGTSSPTISET